MTTLIAIVLFVGGIGLFGFGYIHPLPQPETQAVWLPPNREIQDARDVQPGTFKITKRTLPEFQELVGEEKVLVVYRESFISFLSSSPSPLPHIEYWLPRKDGTFYYYRQEISLSGQQPYSGTFWTKWKAEFDGHGFIVTPSRGDSLVFIGGAMVFAVAMMIVLGLFPSTK